MCLCELLRVGPETEAGRRVTLLPRLTHHYAKHVVVALVVHHGHTPVTTRSATIDESYTDESKRPPLTLVCSIMVQLHL